MIRLFFQMISHYYSCELDYKEQKGQNLDDYEKKLEMIPVWIDSREALELNRAVLRKNPSPPRWTQAGNHLSGKRSEITVRISGSFFLHKVHKAALRV